MLRRTSTSSLAFFSLGALLLAACPDDDTPPLPDTPDAGFVEWTLDDPAPNGWQFVTGEFDVEPGAEVQRCYFIAVPDVHGDGTDVWVDRFKTAINPGSHHMNVFRVKTIVGLDGAVGTMVDGGECFKGPNWADWPLVVNSQNSQPGDPYTDWQLPENVATRFTPGEKLMVQVHYVNAATQETPFSANAGVNFYGSLATAPIELGTLFATQQSIRICQSDPQPSYSGACSFGATAPVTVVAANGHFHSRGKAFSMFEWDGTSTTEPAATNMFYESDNWEEPVMSIGLTKGIAPMAGIWWTCDFQWQAPAAPSTCADINAADKEMANDCCYTFGPKVETSEHCNAFVYYYPKSADVFCN